MSGRRLALLLLPMLACSTESGRLRAVRTEFYSAIARFDAPALHAVVAPDYLEIDQGHLFNLDSLLSEIATMSEGRMSVQYLFADSAVRVEPPVGWVVYRARKILTRQGAADTSFTIESATFRREGSGWKLVLLHRTPLTAAAFGRDSSAPPAPAPAPDAAGARTQARE